MALAIPALWRALFSNSQQDGTGDFRSVFLPFLSPAGTDECGTVVDSATRVSKQGAVTWWHLDDCGEWTYQAALPLPHEPAPEQLGFLGASEGEDERSKPIVKVFLFAGKESYDFITQDDFTNRKGAFAQLDPFNTPEEGLPPVLPKLWVALLRAGGRPLLSPPNLPHLVITARDCVMVEQRRVSRLFLDETWYFAERTRSWQHRPVAYEFVERTLRDRQTCIEDTVTFLLGCIRSNSRYCTRACASLRALVDGDFSGVLSQDIPEDVRKHVFEVDKPAFDSRWKRNAWLVDLLQRPHVARGVLRLPEACQATSFRVSGERLEVRRDPYTPSEWSIRGKGAMSFLACVHVGGRPHFGPVRESVATAKADRKALQDAAVNNGLTEKLISFRSG